MRIALSPSLYAKLNRRDEAQPMPAQRWDVTIILVSDTERYLRDNWRMFNPVQVNTAKEAEEFLNRLEELERLE